MYHVDFWHKDRNPRKEETESNFLKCVVSMAKHVP